MTIAVLLVTCGRLELTRQTLETFSAQNPDARERFLLLHAADAAPEADQIVALASAHGFETVVQHPTRRGYRTGRVEAIQIAADRGADWVLQMDNDMEWDRPFPWPLVTHLAEHHPDVYCLRLFGAFKGRNRQEACFTCDLSRQRRLVRWRPLPGTPEACEVARIHWGGPLLLTRMAEMLRLQRAPIQPGYDDRGDSQPEVSASGRVDFDVARVVTNVAYHIGGGSRTVKPRARERRRVRPAVRPAVRRRPASKAPIYSPAWQETRQWADDGSACCLELAWHALGLPGSMLDVGCGRGSLVTLAQARGVESMGLDLSYPDPVGTLRHADLREPVDVGRTFDLVLCWEVAEHLPAESAETLCDTLLRHVTSGGILLFTAATPGQGGDAHINEQTASYWRQRLAARGLEPDALLTLALAQAWTQAAPRTPWYGKNLQVFRAPGTGATFAPIKPNPAPRVAIAMRTADRSPKPNYVGGTVARFLSQGIDPALLHLCATHPNVDWLMKELHGAPVTLHVPARPLTANENGLQQIRVLDPASADWVLLLEDDLAFCADFLGSVQRWIVKAARPDRHVYRLFGFGLRAPKKTGVASYDWKLQGLCGSQAVLLRMEDAQDFLAWSDANLATWGGFRGNVKIAFDKLLASWALHRWPDQPGVVSHPLFVQHIGDKSSLHPRAIRMDHLFGGAGWRYTPQEATA